MSVGIDLIPNSWRERRRVRLAVRQFIKGLGLCLLVVLPLRAWIFYSMQETQKQIVLLEAEKAKLDQAMAVYRPALERLNRLKQLADQLDANRQFSLVEKVLTPLDTVFSAGIRLDRLEVSISKPEKDKPEKDKSKTPLLQLTLSGQAPHAMQFTEFTQRMASQKGWQDLKVLKAAPAQDGLSMAFSVETAVIEAKTPKGP